MSDIINGREIGRLEITKYAVVPALKFGGHNILVSMVKALDVNGNYIKFLPLDEAAPLLSKYPVVFKESIR